VLAWIMSPISSYFSGKSLSSSLACLSPLNDSITFLLYTFLNLLLHLDLHSGRNAVEVSDYPESAYEPLEQQRGNGEIIALDSYSLAQSDPEEFK
jgi:hypothetical protein